MNEMETRQGMPLDDARLAVIAAEINVIKEQARATVLAAACEIGKRLLEAKNGIPHGKFAEWLKNNVDCSIRQAQQMMALYEEYGKSGNHRAMESLSVSQAVALLAAPAEVREELIESGAAEGMSVRALKDEITRQKQEIEESQLTIAQLETDMEKQKALAEINAERADTAEKKQREAENNAAEAERAGRQAAAEKNDFMRRSEFYQKKATNLEAQLAEAQAGEKIVEIEVIPPDIQRELDRLRELERKAPEEAVIKGRDSYGRIEREFNILFDIIGQMSEEWAGKYRKVCAKALHTMAARLEAKE